MDESHIMTNHQDTSTERERFEVWITPKLKAGSHLNKSASGIYLDNRVAAKWSAWQAALASRDEAAQQPQGQVVSDEEIASIVRAVEDKDKVPSFSNGFYTLTPEELSAFTSAILALRGKPDQFPDAAKMMPVSGWQPIETAPKDGTQIILTNGVSVAQGEWLHQEPYARENRDLDGRYISQDEFDGFDGWIDFVGGMLPEPTHWQPLPPPPNGITAKEQGNGN